MAISFTGLYNQTHQFSAGSIAINTPFIGNLLAIEVTTKPEYAPNTQVIGYLYQHYQTSSKGYALRSGKDVISLELPETDSLTFVPTPHLSDSYTLSLRYAIAGAFVEQSNTAPIPQNILLLPNQVMAIEQAIQYLNDQISTGSLSVSWDEITAKPTSFNPSSHNHEILEINGLTTALNSKASSGHNHSISEVSGLTDTLNAKSNTGHTHSISNIDGLSTELGDIATDLVALDTRVGSLEGSLGLTLKERLVTAFASNGSITLTDVSIGIQGIYELATSAGSVVSAGNLTSNTSNSNFTVNQSSSFSSSFNAFRLFDGVLNPEPDWCSDSSAPQWVSMDFNKSQGVGAYSITPSNVSITNSNTPRNFTLQGSNNNSTWVDLDTRTNVIGWSAGIAQIFTLSIPANYRYYRLFVSQTNGGNFVRIGELILFGANIPSGYVKKPLNEYSVIADYSDFSTHVIKKLSAGTAQVLIKYL